MELNNEPARSYQIHLAPNNNFRRHPLYYIIHRGYKARVNYTLLPLFLYIPQILKFSSAFDVFLMTSIGGNLVSALKILFGVPRPFYVTRGITLWHSISESIYSFPSNHAMAAAVASAILIIQSGYKWWSFFAGGGWTAIVCLSRMSLSVHYLQDIIASLLLAFLFALVYNFKRVSTDLMREWKAWHILISSLFVVLHISTIAVLTWFFIRKPPLKLLTARQKRWHANRTHPDHLRAFLLRCMYIQLHYLNDAQPRKVQPYVKGKLTQHGGFLAGALFGLALRLWTKAYKDGGNLLSDLPRKRQWSLVIVYVGTFLILLASKTL